MTITYYQVGIAPSTTPYSQDTFLDNISYTEDRYSFSIGDRSSINLNLHNITSGDNADLSLYQDFDRDGVLDPGEPELKRSLNASNANDSINWVANAGNYIATVRYGPDSAARLDYELDLSATPVQPSSTDPPNLLPNEVEVGPLTGSQTFSNAVGEADSVDTYAFSLGLFQGVNISLSGLIDDADIRLVRDINSNQIVDLDVEEYIGSSINSGVNSESINLELSGDYFLQVYQYSGNTNYDLEFNQYSTPYA